MPHANADLPLQVFENPRIDDVNQEASLEVDQGLGRNFMESLLETASSCLSGQHFDVSGSQFVSNQYLVEYGLAAVGP